VPGPHRPVRQQRTGQVRRVRWAGPSAPLRAPGYQDVPSSARRYTAAVAAAPPTTAARQHRNTAPRSPARH